MTTEPRGYRLVDTPRLVLGSLADLMSRRRSPSLGRKKDKKDARKCSAPAGLELSVGSRMEQKEPTPSPSEGGIQMSPTPHRKSVDVMNCRPKSAVSPIVRVQYTEQGRNLLNKNNKEGPPSTIKESSESSQTIDENESEKGSGQLKHENTVVRADAPPKTVNAAHSALRQEVVRVTQQLLDSISCKDFDSYTKLCDVGMTCFEPEALGNLIEGTEFHRFYFDCPSTSTAAPRKNQLHTTMLNPNVHMIGEEGACIAYVRLTQYLDRNGECRTRQSQETLVWQKKSSRWICVHVHRSGAPSSTSAALP